MSISPVSGADGHSYNAGEMAGLNYMDKVLNEVAKLAGEVKEGSNPAQIQKELLDVVANSPQAKACAASELGESHHAGSVLVNAMKGWVQNDFFNGVSDGKGILLALTKCTRTIVATAFFGFYKDKQDHGVDTKTSFEGFLHPSVEQQTAIQSFMTTTQLDIDDQEKLGVQDFDQLHDSFNSNIKLLEHLLES